MTAKRWVLALATGALTMTLAGGVALAAFQPPARSDPTGFATLDATAAGLVSRDLPKDKLKATLDALVAKGTITLDQENAILKALADAAPKPPAKPRAPSVRAFLGDLTGASAKYLGLSPKELLTQLRSGRTMADIADGMKANSKSSAELATILTNATNDRIDKAVAAKKLTAEQAAALKSKVTTEIPMFLQRTFTKPLPKPAAPKT